MALLVLATFATATTAAEPQPPFGASDAESAAIQALGPGEPDEPVVAAACPAFHWGISAKGTPAAIELRVSRLAEAANGLETRPVLERHLPGPSRLWTPYVGDCLERGGVYACTGSTNVGSHVALSFGGDGRLLAIYLDDTGTEPAQALKCANAFCCRSSTGSKTRCRTGKGGSSLFRQEV